MAELTLPAPTVDGETARRTVEEVLGRPEYAGLEPGWWDRVTEGLRRAVGVIFDGLQGTGAGSALGWIVLVALLVGAGWLVWRWARTLRGDGAAGLATAEDVGRSPAAWLDDAAAHEAAGRWRDAVRCRYRALVARLAEAGRLEEVPGRTAGEYLAAVRADHPAGAEPFAAATAVFEQAWYGAGEVTDDDVAAVRDAADAVLRVLGLATPATAGEPS
jgi:hypothetical protein